MSINFASIQQPAANQQSVPNAPFQQQVTNTFWIVLALYFVDSGKEVAFGKSDLALGSLNNPVHIEDKTGNPNFTEVIEARNQLNASLNAKISSELMNGQLFTGSKRPLFEGDYTPDGKVKLRVYVKVTEKGFERPAQQQAGYDFNNLF